MMNRRTLMGMGMWAAVAMLWCGTGCKSAPTIPEAQSMPTGVKLSGVWYSDQFEQMYIRQTGDEVRGVYTYKYGGTFEGKITGNLIKFKWLEPGDSTSARRTFKGEGYWQVSKEGDRIFLKGKWGYEGEMTGGGPWNAEHIRDLEGADPKSIEDYRKSGVR